MGKKVTFSDHIQVKQMLVWRYAYRKARISPWIAAAADRVRFQRRIKTIEDVINPVLLDKINKIGI